MGIADTYSPDIRISCTHKTVSKISFPILKTPSDVFFIENFQDALISLGVSQSKDQAGSALGVFWSPNTIDPKNMTRSYSRSAYYDNFAGRKNLHVMTSRHVTKLLTKADNNGVKITGIQVSKSLRRDTGGYL